MGADFTPSLDGYTGQGAFRFWCQKVLPLVYDDSLSYYELLCKVVDYLNNVIQDVGTAETNIGKLLEAYDELQGYVNDYFDNLDVQEEINSKLNEMALDGSLTALIEPILPEMVSEWLNEHITPTSPAVDNTLSVAGAAADAKAVGDSAILKGGAITSAMLEPEDSVYRNANTFPANRILIIPTTIDQTMIKNLPVYGETGYFVSFTPLNYRAGIQVYMTNVSQRSNGYWRTVNVEGAGIWQAFVNKEQLDKVYQPSYLYITTNNADQYPDANDLPHVNRTYCYHADITPGMVANLPDYGLTSHLTYFTFSDTKAGVQFFANSLRMFYRVVTSEGSGTWHQIGLSDDVKKCFQPSFVLVTPTIVAQSTELRNANTFPTNRTYAITPLITSSDYIENLPVYGISQYLSTYSYAENDARYQISVTADNDAYFRYGTKAWIKIANNANVIQSNTPVFNIENYFVKTIIRNPVNLTTGTGVYIFGDSITTTSHGGFTWGQVIATKTGCTEYNYGVGSSAFVHYDQANLRIIDQINSVPVDSDNHWTNCDVVFVAAGTNDANYGTSAIDLRSAVNTVITEIQTHAPNAHIIFITPIQRAQANRNASLPMIAGAISNIALENGCSVINGFDIPIPCYSNDCIDELTDNDGLHPNATGKRIYGDYILYCLR